MEELEPKAKRVRINPTKKWCVQEEKSIIEYLMANRGFEKPTAQAYYKRFSSEANLKIEWNQARANVRNMRASYNKAKSWEGSTGAGTMNGETIKAALFKRCTFFYELEDIFESRFVENVVIDDTLDSFSVEILDFTEADINRLTATDSLSPNTISKEAEVTASSSRKGSYSRTALSDIMESRSKMLRFRKEKAEKDFQLREKEITLKKNEIESNERLKIMELEMRERVAMQELKWKYK